MVKEAVAFNVLASKVAIASRDVHFSKFFQVFCLLRFAIYRMSCLILSEPHSDLQFSMKNAPLTKITKSMHKEMIWGKNYYNS